MEGDFLKRSRKLNSANYREGAVIYWMSRDQRVQDNWALFYAASIASQEKKKLKVVFILQSKSLQATWRVYSFMLTGLRQVEVELKKKNISFEIVLGRNEKDLVGFFQKAKPGIIIGDFNPLRLRRSWSRLVAKKIDCAFYQVDARNIIPCWELSDKQEYAAYTIRKKVQQKLDEFLVKVPTIRIFDKENYQKINNHWDDLNQELEIDFSVDLVDSINSGEVSAKEVLRYFINNRLKGYAHKRNDPNLDWVSGLSPYLHFGQIFAGKVALEVKTAKGIPKNDKESFLEELIVRRELSDNFCFYNHDYDKPSGFPDWAKKTIKEHIPDKREKIYHLSKLEKAQTMDELWNAAQRQLLQDGKMHGWLRMYWAKKILEWSPNVEIAMKNAIYLNDKYELDGQDSNGYTGIAWSMGGVHDRPWPERNIFGMVRYMNFAGAKRKFDVAKFIEKYKD